MIKGSRLLIMLIKMLREDSPKTARRIQELEDALERQEMLNGAYKVALGKSVEIKDNVVNIRAVKDE